MLTSIAYAVDQSVFSVNTLSKLLFNSAARRLFDYRVDLSIQQRSEDGKVDVATLYP